jgi:hypothetical protein
MSLNFDLTKIKDHEEVCFTTAKSDDPGQGIKAGDRIMNPLTNALIWATMSVGWGVIEEETYEAWFERLRLVERTSGPFLFVNGGQPYSITKEDVRKHIGLRTNVFPKKTDAQFFKHVMNMARTDGLFNDPSSLAKRSAASLGPVKEGLEAAQKMIDEALPKFDWGKSALDANAIMLLNETPQKVKAALKALELHG